jgi:DnaJ family protein A protein 1
MVKHGDSKYVLNKGMPVYCRPYENGCLIKFKVNFHENGFLSPDKFSLLKRLLKMKEVAETDEMEQVDPNQKRGYH